jgi:hypothetical protein
MSSSMHTSEAQERFADMLQHLCVRPKMYTFDGRFHEVIVYIEGYIRGSGFPSGEYNLESGMEPFGRWLAARSGRDSDQTWHRILLEHCGGDEERAVQQLWPLYEEYMVFRGEPSRD